MSTKEITTQAIKMATENEFTQERTGAIQQEVLQALSETFDRAEDLPETLLINSAQRLANLSHSLFETREKAYLESDEHLPNVDPVRVDDICKLAEASANQMRLALEFKKARVSTLKIIKDMGRE